MTVLVAIQGDGWTVMGCDSRASSEYGDHMILATPKIIENNGVLIGGCGMGRGSNILQFGWDAPEPGATQDIDSFMSKIFIPEMRKEFIEAGYDMKWDGEAAGHDSAFLVSVKGIIYPIFSDYGWDRDVRGVYVMGSGGDIALGALDALEVSKIKTPRKAETVVRKAIASAIKHNVFCSEPIYTSIQYADEVI